MTRNLKSNTQVYPHLLLHIKCTLLFSNNVFFQKISELRQSNISETRENEKFRKFCLTQGLIINHTSVPSPIPAYQMYFIIF